jgi:hypothetical protein
MAHPHRLSKSKYFAYTRVSFSLLYYKQNGNLAANLHKAPWQSFIALDLTREICHSVASSVLDFLGFQSSEKKKEKKAVIVQDRTQKKCEDRVQNLAVSRWPLDR